MSSGNKSPPKTTSGVNTAGSGTAAAKKPRTRVKGTKKKAATSPSKKAGAKASSPATRGTKAKHPNKPTKTIGTSRSDLHDSLPPQVNEGIQTLLELHVQHELDACEPAILLAWVRQNLRQIYTSITSVLLSDLVSQEQVKSVIKRFVVEQEMPDAVADLTSESVLSMLATSYHQDTKLSDIINRSQFEEFLDQLLVFDQQRKSILNAIVDLPVYRELISGVVYEAIVRYIQGSNILSKNIPGVSSMLKIGRSVVNKSAPRLGGAVEESVRSYINDNLGFITKQSKRWLEGSLTDETLRKSVMDLWTNTEHQTLEELQGSNEHAEVEKLLMLIYHFVDDVSKTGYFSHGYALVVDGFFSKYGQQPLATLLNDLQITPERMMSEAEEFAPGFIRAFKDSGQLEILLRQRLQSFYSSDPALTFFNKHIK